MAQGERETPAHAYLDFFRDLSIYDFYRRGEPGPPEVSTLAPPALADLLPLENPILLQGESRPSPAQEVPVPPAVSIQDRWPILQTPGQNLPDRQAALTAIRDGIGDCTRCPLAYAGRRSIVFGEGNPGARLMFVGEGPGAGRRYLRTPLHR